MESDTDQHPRTIVERLMVAINAHDLDGVVACFADDVESHHPAHPSRSFRGTDRVRSNWRRILGGVPDLRANLVSCVVDGPSAWTEWIWNGTREDGGRFEMRGVTIQVVRDGAIASVRFFMEPVEVGGAAVSEAVGRVVTGR